MTPIPEELRLQLTKAIMYDLFKGGPKDGHVAKILLTEDPNSVAFESWNDSRHFSKSKINRLYWDATVQSTWVTSIFKRGIALVDGHPILFARRLQTKNWETFEVIGLKRGRGFEATIVKGFVLRLGDFMTFDEDRLRAIKRLRATIRRQTVERLNRSFT